MSFWIAAPPSAAAPVRYSTQKLLAWLKNSLLEEIRATARAVLNGPALYEKGDTAWRDIPVIVITALDLGAKDCERLNSGIQSVLVKNAFQPSELVARIRRLVLPAQSSHS